jgi:3-dehydroquinate synthase
VIVTDDNVAALHLNTLTDSLVASKITFDSIVLPAGEGSKNFATLQKLLDQLLTLRVERRDTVIALGGGVIGDLTGFAAAVLRRGMAFIQIPTSLLAQVDSSVGGKTGINTEHGKNLVGAFHQPKLVLADVSVLGSLSRRELMAGYAEVAKYGLLGNAEFFTWLEKNSESLIAGDLPALSHAVLTSCQMKADIVAADEREGGVRALLNLGHTFGHALEAEAGYGGSLLHGEAVAIGMVQAFKLSAALGYCDAAESDRVVRHLSQVGLPTTPRQAGLNHAEPTVLIDHMRQDKKVEDGKMTFILARAIGDAFITRDIAVGDLERLLAEECAA